MTATAGYNASLKKSGTSTSFIDESMTNTTGDTWSIDDISKNIWDRSTTPVFAEDDIEIDEADILSIDYLFRLWIRDDLKS